MIYLGTKEIAQVFRGNKEITAIYKGARLIWESIKSCFGKGYWIDIKQWSDTDAWKDK